MPVAFAAALVAQSSSHSGALPGAVPVPKRGPWLARHQGFVAEARRGGVDLLFLGDSITDSWRTVGAAVWAQRFAPLKSANFGISGDRTQHLLWRLQNGELDGIQPRVVVLLIGINNVAQAHPETPASAAAGIEAVVRELRARLPRTRVLLLAVFPCREKPDHPLRISVGQINDAVARLDDGGRSVVYVDLAGAFLEADGTIPRELMPDFLHLSAKGYERWANAVREPLARLLK